MCVRESRGQRRVQITVITVMIIQLSSAHSAKHTNTCSPHSVCQEPFTVKWEITLILVATSLYFDLALFYITCILLFFYHVKCNIIQLPAINDFDYLSTRNKQTHSLDLPDLLMQITSHTHTHTYAPTHAHTLLSGRKHQTSCTAGASTPSSH